jgi:tRNA nucleotidyltransferase (CCA-adding enzyme)
LRGCGALRVVFPEVDKLFGVPQPVKWHPEVDTGLHTMLVMDEAEKLSDAPEVRFAALVHDIGKGMTDAHELPSHPGHEKRGARMVRAMAKRLPLPRACRDLGMLVAEYHTHCHRALELRTDTIVKLLESLDAFRRPDRFELFLAACEADARGRTGLEKRDYPQSERLRAALAAARAVDAAAVAEAAGERDIAADIRRARVTAVSEALAGH